MNKALSIATVVLTAWAGAAVVPTLAQQPGAPAHAQEEGMGTSTDRMGHGMMGGDMMDHGMMSGHMMSHGMMGGGMMAGSHGGMMRSMDGGNGRPNSQWQTHPPHDRSSD